MFTLQRLNVIRIVEDEYSKAKLITEGFIEIIEKESKKIKEVISKKSKGKD
jgi:GMP synthase PP-ATPase subunit